MILRSSFRKLGGLFRQRRNSQDVQVEPAPPSAATCQQRLLAALHDASWEHDASGRLEAAADAIADAIVFLNGNKAHDDFCEVCELITEVLLSFIGEPLTTLKLRVDVRLRSACLDLTAFVFDFENATPKAKELNCRQRVLHHFARSALQTRKAGSRFSGRYVVLTDVDDTLFPAGVLGGSDCSYVKKVRYPGMMSFFEGLTGPELPVVALTARPPVLGQHTLQSLQRKRIFVHDPDRQFFLLYGRVSDMVSAAVGTLSASARQWAGFGASEHKKWYDSIADTKFFNYLEFSRVYPELDMVFVGDAGQGDLTAGRRMLKLGAFSAAAPLNASRSHPVTEAELEVSATGDDVLPNPLRAVFVKEVLRQRFSGPIVGFFPDPHIRLAHESQDVLIFDNYVDAACAAVRHGLVPLHSVRHVGSHAKSEVDDDIRTLTSERARLDRYRFQLETSESLLLSAESRPTPRPALTPQQLETVLSVDPADSITNPDEIAARQAVELGLADTADSLCGSPPTSPDASLVNSVSVDADADADAAADAEAAIPVVEVLAAAGVISKETAWSVTKSLSTEHAQPTTRTREVLRASEGPTPNSATDVGAADVPATSDPQLRPLSSEMTDGEEKLMEEIVPILERAAAAGAEAPDLVQIASRIVKSLSTSSSAESGSPPSTERAGHGESDRTHFRDESTQ